jgi:hypothetical protein
MRTDPRPDEVRKLVSDVLERFQSAADGGRPRLPLGVFRGPQSTFYRPLSTSCVPPSTLPTPDETILIDQGRYVARSYRTPGYLAMWLVEAGIVQFYSSTGDMLATVNLFERLEPQKMAA